MPEIKESPPPVVKQEKTISSRIKEILKTTGDCLSGKLSPIDAFHEIAGRNPNSKETPESTVTTDETNKEIEDITNEIKTYLPPEPLIIKDEYYLEREKKWGTFIDSNQTQHEKKHPVYSVFSILKLKTSGVKNATDFYNVLHQRGFRNDHITDKQTIKILKDLDTDKIGLGIDRINKLGFVVYGVLNDRYYDNRQLISEVSNIPDDKFDNACLDISPYFFLNRENEYDSSGIYTPLKTLIEITKNGQLDPEAKNRLDLIRETIILRNENEYFSNFISICGSNNQGLHYDFQSFINVDNKLTLDLPEGENLDAKLFNSNFKLIYKNLDKFRNPTEFFKRISQEQIDQLPNNKNGVADFLKQVYEANKGNKYSADDIINYVIKNQNKIHSSFKDESKQYQFLLDLVKSTSQDQNDKYGRINFIIRLKSINITKIISFSNKNDQNYWETISRINDFALLESLIDNKDQFFEEDNFPKPSFFETIVKNHEDSSLVIKYLYDDSFLESPFEDKTKWLLFSDIYSSNFGQQENFQKFFADNISDFSKFIDQDNHFNNHFLESLLTSKVDIPIKLVSEENLVNFNNQDKIIWSLYRDIYPYNFGQQENFQKFFADNISDFSKFIENNKPNSLFFESLLTINFNIPIKLLSEENIIKFLDQDKKIWELLIKFNKGKGFIEGNEINKLILKNKSQANDIFDNQEKIELITSDKDLDIKIGKVFNKLSSSACSNINQDELVETTYLLLKQDQLEINKSNWKSILKFYIYSQDEDNIQGNPELKLKMKVLFEDPKARNLCLSEMQDEWRSYLNSTNSEELPFSLKLLSEFIKDEGAGPLSQIESLGLLIDSVYNSFSQKTTFTKTKNEILTGFSEIEAKFIKNRWSNENKTDFYNISRDVVDAAPSLFSDYLTLFKKLSPSELVSFSKDIYPLYKTKLILMEKTDISDKKYYEKNDLLNLRKDIRNFADFDSKKEELLKDIKERFSTRFEIIKTPENFSQENIRSIKDISMYLSNLTGRTPEKEAILGFYLSLNINDSWNNFRNGQEINPREYLSENKSVVIEKFLEERKETTKAIIESVGIEDKNIPEFIKLLQEETQFSEMGDVETIDIKLNNIIQNLNELQDLDLYPDYLDKQRMKLLQIWGNKEVGSAVKKMWQQLSSSEENISLSENETKIKEQLIDICKTTGLDSNDPQILKENFQERIKAFSTLTNMSSSVEKLDVLGEIGKLRNNLEPSPEIIEIFQRIGEDFKVSSGAVALSQDLDYLDNLVVKKEDLIKPEERKIISKYITTIKTQVLKLEEIYGQIKNKFENLKQGNSNSKNELLNQKLKEIETVINSQSTQQVITSTATNNLNVITENMRACLACTNKGINNDTDLTFGDINKFYLYSQSENQSKGSISDQLAYLEPITRQNGSQEASFVIDNLYGLRTPSILENQVETVIKKARIIKQRFPNTKTSVFVSSAALSSSGTPNETLIKKLHDSKISAQTESIEVNIIKSAAGDHYIEIGGDARTAGKRNVSGIIINI